MTERISRADLHAFIDDALDVERRAEIARILAASPADAADVAVFRAQKAALAEALNAAIAIQPSPRTARLTGALHWRLRAQRTWRTVRRPVFAALAASLLLFLIPSGVIPAGERTDYVDEAVNAHRVFANDRLRPVEVAAADSSELFQWLSERLGEPVDAPELADIGYIFLGGRLVRNFDEPAAQFTYEGRQGNRVTVYLTLDADDEPSMVEIRKDADASGETAAYWSDGTLAYAVVGESSEAVRQVASLAAAQIARSRP